PLHRRLQCLGRGEPRHQRSHRQAPRREHPAEVRCEDARRSGGGGAHARPRVIRLRRRQKTSLNEIFVCAASRVESCKSKIVRELCCCSIFRHCRHFRCVGCAPHEEVCCCDVRGVFIAG